MFFLRDLIRLSDRSRVVRLFAVPSRAGIVLRRLPEAWTSVSADALWIVAGRARRLLPDTSRLVNDLSLDSDGGSLDMALLLRSMCSRRWRAEMDRGSFLIRLFWASSRRVKFISSSFL